MEKRVVAERPVVRRPRLTINHWVSWYFGGWALLLSGLLNLLSGIGYLLVPDLHANPNRFSATDAAIGGAVIFVGLVMCALGVWLIRRRWDPSRFFFGDQ